MKRYSIKLQSEIDDIAFHYQEYDELTDGRKFDLSMMMLREDDENWIDNDEIFTPQIKRMLLDRLAKGDKENEKIYEIENQLSKNIVEWCKDDLESRIERSLHAKLDDDKWINAIGSQADYYEANYV